MSSGEQYILAVDQGTSSTKTVVFDHRGRAVARGYEPLHTSYLPGGLVEQDPEAIVKNVLASVRHCTLELIKQEIEVSAVAAIGISNQRETFVVWDRAGKPLYNAVVWQCKRSVDICRRLGGDAVTAALIRERTGLVVDPYFSGSKLVWLYEQAPAVRSAIDHGEAFFGTIDSWLLYRLTGGSSYFTDYTNASRTLFFNIRTLDWDRELLELFGLRHLNLPRCVPSSFAFGETDFFGLLAKPTPVMGMIGDSHAAAFGQGCFEPGLAKATLGTGCSVMMNIGAKPVVSASGMVTTVCWSTEDQVCYALEGVIVTCGATIEWLKKELGLLADSRETEAMATALEDNAGVYIVPAFSGLGAPWWQMDRKASIHGLTLATSRNHLVRAALESIPYQVKDVLLAMEADAGLLLKQLMVDGGISGNRWVMGFLAALLVKEVVVSGFPEVSALGAAYMAGLKAGVYRDIGQLRELKLVREVVTPGGEGRHEEWYAEWRKVVMG